MKKLSIITYCILFLMLAACSKEETENTVSDSNVSSEVDFVPVATTTEEFKSEVTEEYNSAEDIVEKPEGTRGTGADNWEPSPEWNEDGIEGAPINIEEDIALAKELGLRITDSYKYAYTLEETNEILEYFDSMNSAYPAKAMTAYLNYYEPDSDEVYLWTCYGMVKGCSKDSPKIWGDLDCGEKGVHRVICQYTGDNRKYYNGWVFHCDYFDKGDPFRENEKKDN